MKSGWIPMTALAAAALTALGAAGTPKAERPSPYPEGYHLTRKILLGGEGGWDYLTVDPATQRIFISRSTRVLVVDAESGKQVGEIPDTPGVHGVILVPELKRGFTSNGREGTVTLFDPKTLATLGKVKVGGNPDAILYDPASRRVFTMNGRSRDTTAVDPSKGTVDGTVPLDGRPEFAVADGAGRVYINLVDKSEMAVLNSRRLKVESRWPLAPCEEPTGMAFDGRHRRLFVGCRNKLLAVVDADKGKVITTLPIGKGVDACAFDATSRLVFSSCGDGTLTVIHEDAPDRYTVTGIVETVRGARTLALDPRTHRIYLVTAEFGPPPEATAENPHPWHTVVPGTFRLLVVDNR